MQISVTEAEGQLTDLVRRAEAGDEILLTRHGRPAVRLVPVTPTVSAGKRRALMEDLRNAAAGKTDRVPIAARSQDDLYGDDGLPR